MSANVETARRGFEAFSRDDWDGAMATIHPEIEWHLTFAMPDLPPDKRVFRGHEEVREVWRSFRSAWAQLAVEIEEVLYDEDDVVIERARFAGRGGGSGIEVDRTVFYVLEMRDGLLWRQRSFDTEAEAFASAGVERG